jgi:hypothetical protein
MYIRYAQKGRGWAQATPGSDLSATFLQSLSVTEHVDWPTTEQERDLAGMGMLYPHDPTVLMITKCDSLELDYLSVGTLEDLFPPLNGDESLQVIEKPKDAAFAYLDESLPMSDTGTVWF